MVAYESLKKCVQLATAGALASFLGCLLNPARQPDSTKIEDRIQLPVSAEYRPTWCDANKDGKAQLGEWTNIIVFNAYNPKDQKEQTYLTNIPLIKDSETLISKLAEEGVGLVIDEQSNGYNVLKNGVIKCKPSAIKFVSTNNNKRKQDGFREALENLDMQRSIFMKKYGTVMPEDQCESCFD